MLARQGPEGLLGLLLLLWGPETNTPSKSAVCGRASNKAWPRGGHDAHGFQRGLENERPAEVINLPPDMGHEDHASLNLARRAKAEDACPNIHPASRGRGGLGMSASFCHVLPSHILGTTCKPRENLQCCWRLATDRLQMRQSAMVVRSLATTTLSCLSR